jgi:hypothetical protein
VTPAEAKAKLARMMEQRGETVRIVNVDFGTGAEDTCDARAVVTGFAAHELVAGVDLGERDVLVYADDVTLSTPIVEGTIIILRRATAEETTMSVSEPPDTSTHRMAGVLIAYAIKAKGG